MTDFIAKVLLVVVLCFSLYQCNSDTSKADLTNVQAVYTIAEKSPQTQQLMQAFAAEHPVPTNSELNKIKEKINDVLVLEEARRITNNPTLQAEVAPTPKPKTEKELFYEKIFGWIMNLGMVMLLIFALRASYRMMSRQTE